VRPLSSPGGIDVLRLLRNAPYASFTVRYLLDPSQYPAAYAKLGSPESVISQEGIMKEKRDEAVVHSRRSLMTGSAAFLVGGVAGCASNAITAPAPTAAPAPPLPWKWPMLDPMEAGTRTYQQYLKNKG
jgi:hypothetical protein